MCTARSWLASLIASVVLSPTISYAYDEQDIPLSAVPEHILAAAKSALSGVELVEAELITSDNQLFYELEGVKDDTEYEILISQDGELLKVERDDEND